MAVTQKEIANMVGLSQRAVAFALSGSDHARKQLRPETRQRIINAAQKLGYAPNVNARRLVRGRADHVGLVVRPLASPFFGEMTDQFVREFSKFDLRVSVEVADVTEEATFSSVRNFAGAMVDVVFVCPSRPSMSFDRIKTAAECPVIGLVHKPSDPLVPYVGFDLREGARQATRRLLKLGRRQIGFVGAADKADGRFEGYCDALLEAGVSSDPAWHLFDDLYHLEFAYEAGKKLAGLSHKPDALFVSSDPMAMSVISGLTQQEVRVPEDVAVVSLTGDKMGEYYRPALTTMALPLSSMVRRCLEMTQMIHEGKTKQDVLAASLELRAEMVVRESCGKNIIN